MKKLTQKTATKKLTKKTNVVKKVKNFLAGRTPTSKWADEGTKPVPHESESLYIHPHSDMRHGSAHDSVTGLKNHPQNQSALNQMSRAEKIKRTSATNRRIITGAAVGKTGQIVIK